MATNVYMNREEHEEHPDFWRTGEFFTNEPFAVTYANIYPKVWLDGGEGAYECRVFTTVQSIYDDVGVDMRIFAQRHPGEDNLERLELMAIFDALKYVPRLCGTNIYVSSEAVQKAIEDFEQSANKAAHPHADLLYAIYAVGSCFGITVCPSPYEPLLKFEPDFELDEILVSQFYEYMVKDMEENAELGQYIACGRAGYDYVYGAIVQVHGEMRED